MYAYDDFVDFLVQTDPRALANFHWSPEARHRLDDLERRREGGRLETEEQLELERFAAAEHFLNLARARLAQRLSSE
jgi:hypothetical protein